MCIILVVIFWTVVIIFIVVSQTLKMISQAESFICPDKQGTPEEGWRIWRLKHCVSMNNNKDKVNSLKNHNQNNTQKIPVTLCYKLLFQSKVYAKCIFFIPVIAKILNFLIHNKIAIWKHKKTDIRCTETSNIDIIFLMQRIDQIDQNIRI